MKKTKHLILIFFIYLFTFLASILFFKILPIESFILKIIICDVFATFIIFLFSTACKNSSIYDPYWSVAPLLILPFFVKEIDLKTLLLMVPLTIWGVRLTINWIKTFRDLKYQDWRYDYYRNKSGKLWPLVNFFGIHLMPTIIVIGVMIPGMLYLESNKQINALTALGCVLSLIGIALEDIADRSAHKFRKKNPGKVNNTGLWKYSRHPNYLGEITFWWGVFVMMLSIEPNLFEYIIGPIANSFLFLFISIPLMERRQLQNKPKYRDYQKTTSMLLLLPPKKIKSKETSY